MTKDERHDWIMAYIRKHGVVSAVNQAFVDAYVAATGATYSPTMYGSNKCRKLYLDLGEMSDDYRLKRVRTGIKGMAGMGFPNWVWTYSLAIEEAV